MRPGCCSGRRCCRCFSRSRACRRRAFGTTRQLMAQIDYNVLFRWFVGSLVYRPAAGRSLLASDGVQPQPRPAADGGPIFGRRHPDRCYRHRRTRRWSCRTAKHRITLAADKAEDASRFVATYNLIRLPKLLTATRNHSANGHEPDRRPKTQPKTDATDAQNPNSRWQSDLFGNLPKQDLSGSKHPSPAMPPI